MLKTAKKSIAGQTDRRTDRPTDRPTDGPTDGGTDKPSYRDARTHQTSSGGRIDASVVVLYATAMFLGCFGRFSAVFHEC